MSNSYKERETINAALQAGRKAASRPERTLTEAEFQELETLAANCPIPVPLKVVRRAAKLRDELAGLLQMYILPPKGAVAIRQNIAEKRTAIDVWGKWLTGLTAEAPANVVALGTAVL